MKHLIAAAAALLVALPSAAGAAPGPVDAGAADVAAGLATDAGSDAGGAETSSSDSRNGAQVAADGEKYSVSLDQTTRWAPFDGPVRFTVSGIDPKDPPRVVTCFRWKLTDQKPDCNTAPERVSVTPDGTVTFSVDVPFGFRDQPKGVAMVPMMPVIPVAELQIHVLKTGPTPGAAPTEIASYIREIGVTSKVRSAVLAFGFFVLALGALFFFVRSLRFESDGRWNIRKLVLHAISQSNGWASLSQFQILLWTLLIATGAVYVVTLTGSLLVLTSGTLILLGIAGATVVGTQFQASKSTVKGDTLAPGPVTELALVGAPAADGALLSWAAVPGTGIRYTVQSSTDGGNTWSTEAAVEGLRFRLVGAAPERDLRLKVFATNSMGPGQPATINFKTGVATQSAAKAPDPVAQVAVARARSAGGVQVQWTAAVEQASGYQLEYRPHESDRGWQRAGKVGGGETQGLIQTVDANTLYDVRVVSFNEQGEAPASPIRQIVTGPRVPRWSDLVTDSADPRQIDVTRLQMLLFTVISAFFVALKIADSGMIPEIPDSYVTLMGISNGVYLTAKFVGR